jgi:hypothetical protein
MEMKRIGYIKGNRINERNNDLLFRYGLFNDAVDSFDYTAPNGGTINVMNRKGCGRKR